MTESTGDLMLTDDLTAAIAVLEEDAKEDLIPFKADCPACPQLHKKVVHGNNGTLILLRHLWHTTHGKTSVPRPAIVNFVSWSKTNGLKAGGIPAIIFSALAFMWYMNHQMKQVSEKMETMVVKVTEEAKQTARSLHDVIIQREDKP